MSRHRLRAAFLAAGLVLAAGPARSQFDPGDLPQSSPPTPVFSIYDALTAPDRSPGGTGRDGVSGLRADQAAGATCEARDTAVTKLYQRGYDAFDQKDRAEAAYWLRSGLSTRLDPRDGRALTRLGFILVSDSNPAGARAIWELAALSGNRDAAFNLGYLFEAGVGVQPDPDKAIAWYERAQAGGHEKAADAIRRVRAKR